MKAKPKSGPLTEAQLTVLLRERFAAPEYAFMPQVRNGTGWSRRTARTADALAMSLWPSRGLELIGFEVKSDRQDWIREKKDPEKAEEIAKFCDRWWLVVGEENIVKAGELPPTWGLLVPRGGKLHAKVEAPKLEAKPLDRLQLAAILRRAAECVVPRAEIEAKIERARQAGEDLAKQAIKWKMKNLTAELDDLKANLTRFETASGIAINRWNGGESLGKAVRFVLEGGVECQEKQLRNLHQTTKEILADLETRLSELPGNKAKTGTEG